jgi:hypothetical protein
MLKMLHLQARFLTIEDRVVHLLANVTVFQSMVIFCSRIASQDFRNRDCLESLFTGPCDACSNVSASCRDGSCVRCLSVIVPVIRL